MAQARGISISDEGPKYERCVERAHQLLMRAADEWSKGDPEQPPTTDVLNDIIEVFARQKFLIRPFGRGPN